MSTAAAVLFAFAFVAELGGVTLIVREARTANRVLALWVEADNPANEDQGTWAQVLLINKVVRTLLSARARATWAVALVTAGIVAGTAANFLTLGPA